MTHDHNIIDTDKVFTIDPITRNVVNETGAKSKLMQFDHNSERLTFKMPKLVEGHDMLKSDKVQIHFTNVGTGTSVSARAVNNGIYKVKDLQVNSDDPDTIIFSWLIGEESTQLAGTLTFLIKFICGSVDGEPGTDYKWHTYPCTYISIQPGMNNTDEVVEINSDVILELERHMDEIAEKCDHNHITSIDINDAGELVFTFIDGSTTNVGRVMGPQGEKGSKGDPFTYEDFTPEQLDSLRAKIVIGSEEPTTPCLWFNTSGYSSGIGNEGVVLRLTPEAESGTTVSVNGETYGIENVAVEEEPTNTIYSFDII